jgi:hypothetical protein
MVRKQPHANFSLPFIRYPNFVMLKRWALVNVFDYVAICTRPSLFLPRSKASSASSGWYSYSSGQPDLEAIKAKQAIIVFIIVSSENFNAVNTLFVSPLLRDHTQTNMPRNHVHA